MKKAIVLVAGLVASSMSVADVATLSEDMYLYSPYFETKAEAYQAGFDIQNNLASMNDRELKDNLSTQSVVVRSIKVDSTKVEVQELADASNNIMYRAVLDVDYSYDYND